MNELSTALKSEENSKSHIQSAFEQMRSKNEKLNADLKERDNTLQRMQTVNSVS